MFVLSFAFSFPFTAANRQSILPLQKALSLASFLAWSCHLQSLTCCLGRSFCFFQHDMQRTCTFCKHVHSHAKAFLSSFSSCFTSSVSSSLVMLSTVLPFWSSFTTLPLRSFSCLFVQTIYIFCHCVRLSATLTSCYVSGSIALLFTPVLTSPKASFAT